MSLITDVVNNHNSDNTDTRDGTNINDAPNINGIDYPLPLGHFVTILINDEGNEHKSTGGLIMPNHLKDDVPKIPGYAEKLPTLGKVLAIGDDVAYTNNKIINLAINDVVILRSTTPNDQYVIINPPEYNDGNIKFRFAIVHESIICGILPRWRYVNG